MLKRQWNVKHRKGKLFSPSRGFLKLERIDLIKGLYFTAMRLEQQRQEESMRQKQQALASEKNAQMEKAKKITAEALKKQQEIKTQKNVLPATTLPPSAIQDLFTASSAKADTSKGILICCNRQVNYFMRSNYFHKRFYSSCNVFLKTFTYTTLPAPHCVRFFFVRFGIFKNCGSAP